MLLLATAAMSLLAVAVSAAAVYSVWLGGGIAIAGLVSFTQRSLRRDPTQSSAQRLLADIVGAMLLKFALVGVLIGLAAKFWVQLDPLAMLLAFALVSLLGSVLSGWMLLDKDAAAGRAGDEGPGTADKQ